MRGHNVWNSCPFRFVRDAIAVLFMLGGLLVACDGSNTSDGKEGFSYHLECVNINDSCNVVRLFVNDGLADTLLLPYPVYRFERADVTGNGTDEVLVGVVKETKYWHESARRLFIYHLYHGRYIRPLWLGSRVGHPLVDFHVCRDSFPACIHTKEVLRDGMFCYNEYRLRGFGLKFSKEIKRTDYEKENKKKEIK